MTLLAKDPVVVSQPSHRRPAEFQYLLILVLFFETRHEINLCFRKLKLHERKTQEAQVILDPKLNVPFFREVKYRWPHLCLANLTYLSCLTWPVCLLVYL